VDLVILNLSVGDTPKTKSVYLNFKLRLSSSVCVFLFYTQFVDCLYAWWLVDRVS